MGAPHIGDIGAYLVGKGGNAVSITAAGAGDNTKLTGASVDRLGYGSAKVAIFYKTTLGASETLKFAVEYQESSDNSSWDTAVSMQAATTAKTGAVTDSIGVVTLDINLEGKKRYVRFNVTPDLSAAGTDTAIIGYGCVLGGADVLPAA